MTADVRYSSRFQKRYDALDYRIKARVKKALALFVENQFHPSLRLHRFSGKLNRYWSISVDRRHRIIFERETAYVVLVSIGTHAIYEKM